MINRISLIITAAFSLYVFYFFKQIEADKKQIQAERDMYKRAYLECNSERIKVNEIIKADSLKTLVYW